MVLAISLSCCATTIDNLEACPIDPGDDLAPFPTVEQMKLRHRFQHLEDFRAHVQRPIIEDAARDHGLDMRIVLRTKEPFRQPTIFARPPAPAIIHPGIACVFAPRPFAIPLRPRAQLHVIPLCPVAIVHRSSFLKVNLGCAPRHRASPSLPRRPLDEVSGRFLGVEVCPLSVGYPPRPEPTARRNEKHAFYNALFVLDLVYRRDANTVANFTLVMSQSRLWLGLWSGCSLRRTPEMAVEDILEAPILNPLPPNPVGAGFPRRPVVVIE
jgi:hypothetical protein